MIYNNQRIAFEKKFATTDGRLELTEVLEWIRANLSPEDIIGDVALRAWAESLDPEAVFDENVLGLWAEEHGYVWGYEDE